MVSLVAPLIALTESMTCCSLSAGENFYLGTSSASRSAALHTWSKHRKPLSLESVMHKTANVSLFLERAQGGTLP